MANHPSARKRARQNKKRRAANAQVKSVVRGAVKKARLAVTGDPAHAAALVRTAEAELKRAASKGIIPKQRAARKVSRLMKAAHRAKSAGKV
ncbi:MAG: 30S ribosomal protein S20 [Deltaproteobacteria bacterium RBG_13_65_10]|nr:MAG: 30S ribosomal protein S20 [Deltaproteobacteria bacterium RBG_13_65_10]